MSTLPQPVFLFLTDLARRIHDDQTGAERKQVLYLLEQWRKENATAMFSDSSNIKQREAFAETLDLAIKITRSAFIPPWER